MEFCNSQLPMELIETTKKSKLFQKFLAQQDKNKSTKNLSSSLYVRNPTRSPSPPDIKLNNSKMGYSFADHNLKSPGRGDFTELWADTSYSSPKKGYSETVEEAMRNHYEKEIRVLRGKFLYEIEVLEKRHKEQLSKKDKEIYQYQKELSDSKVKNIEIEARLLTGGELDRAIKVLKQEKRTVELENTEMRDTLLSLKKQVEQSKNELESHRNEIDGHQRTSKNKQFEFESEMRNSKELLEDTKRQLSKAKEEKLYNDKKLNTRNDKIKRLTEELERTSRKVSRLEDQLYTIKEEAKFEFDTLYRENEALKQQMNSYPRTSLPAPPFPRQQQRSASPPVLTYFTDDAPLLHLSASPVKDIDTIREKVGVNNSSSIQSVLKWENDDKSTVKADPEYAKKLENQLMQLQMQKERLNNEYTSIPEHAKRANFLIRRKQIEKELNEVHQDISVLRSHMRKLGLIRG